MRVPSDENSLSSPCQTWQFDVGGLVRVLVLQVNVHTSWGALVGKLHTSPADIGQDKRTRKSHDELDA